MLDIPERLQDEGHPRLEVLERFLRGTLAKEDLPAMVVHLVGGCDQCRTAMASIAQASFLTFPPEPPLALYEGRDAYDLVLEKVFDRILLHGKRAKRRQAAVERATAALLAHDVLGMDVARHGAYATFEASLAKSWSLRHEDPKEMLRWATWAVHALGGVNPQRDGFRPEQMADLAARLFGEYANALRINEEFDRAEEVLDRGFEAQKHGTRDDRITFRLVAYLASLRAAQHRYIDARVCMEELEEASRKLGDPAMEANALVQRAIYTGHAGDAVAALQLLDSADRLIDSDQDPRLASQAHHNRLYFLVEAGRLKEAYSILTTQRALLLDGAPTIERAKIAFLEGRLMALSGQDDLAEPLWREVREVLAGRTGVSLPAIVDLHLSALCLRQHRTQEALELARQAAKAFTYLRLRDSQREALTALQSALHQEVLTAAIAQKLAEFFRRAETNPGLRFGAG